MRIEKINENQIRCTLTKEDLASHQVRLSELAYGTEKAKNLFRDMMRQAQTEFGFEADNIPLMIEAIPLNTDSIMLIITKVEEPEELDTRFSKFAPNSPSVKDEIPQFDGADDILDIIQKLYEAKNKGQGKKSASKPVSKSQSEVNEAKETQEEAPVIHLVRMYRFHELDTVIKAAHSLHNFFDGVNALYKDHKNGEYQLVIHQSSATPEEFNKVCNILSEYGSGKNFSHAGEAYLVEHGDAIIAKNALQKLETL